MAETPWTPGPWEVTHNGRIVETKPGAGYGGIVLWGGYDNTTPEAVQANARLISLAPEMAELLSDLLLDFDTVEGYPNGTYDEWAAEVIPVVRRAVDLLARAREGVSVTLGCEPDRGVHRWSMKPEGRRGLCDCGTTYDAPRLDAPQNIGP